jgi:hypothetical protein
MAGADKDGNRGWVEAQRGLSCPFGQRGTRVASEAARRPISKVTQEGKYAPWSA